MSAAQDFDFQTADWNAMMDYEIRRQNLPRPCARLSRIIERFNALCRTDSWTRVMTFLAVERDRLPELTALARTAAFDPEAMAEPQSAQLRIRAKESGEGCHSVKEYLLRVLHACLFHYDRTKECSECGGSSADSASCPLDSESAYTNVILTILTCVKSHSRVPDNLTKHYANLESQIGLCVWKFVVHEMNLKAFTSK